jgi:hypothetical protein
VGGAITHFRHRSAFMRRVPAKRLADTPPPLASGERTPRSARERSSATSVLKTTS